MEGRASAQSKEFPPCASAPISSRGHQHPGISAFTLSVRVKPGEQKANVHISNKENFFHRPQKRLANLDAGSTWGSHCYPEVTRTKGAGALPEPRGPDHLEYGGKPQCGGEDDAPQTMSTFSTPGLMNMFSYREKGTLQLWLSEGLSGGGMTLDPSGGPSIITRFLIRGREEGAESEKATWPRSGWSNVATSQGTQAASRNRKRKGNRSFRKKGGPADFLILVL